VSDWSTGEFRAPSPLDGVPDLPPPTTLAPWSPDTWHAAPDSPADADPPTRLAPIPFAQPGSGASGGPPPVWAVPGAGEKLPGPSYPVWPPVPGTSALLGGAALAPVSLPPPGPGQPARRLPVLPLIGVAAVLAVATAAGLLWADSRTGDARTTAGAPVPAVSVPASVGPADAATTSAPTDGATNSTAGVGADVTPSGPTTTTIAAADVVQSLDGLLDRSVQARGNVASTAIALQSCRVPAATAEDTFRKAQDARNALAAEAAALTAGGVADPQVGEAVRAFVSLQRSSAQADGAFAAWAADVGTAGCSGTAAHTANWDRANRLSGDASAGKARFVKLWNPIAAEHGLTGRSADAI